ncbi:MAG: ribonuclease Y [Peptoniphilaceae bacterium]|uniref:ribonuclease Y n=1 Tax=Parvimonas sp. TaxID=1944660 RepID=UPI0025FAB05A|nr:ribonuclease Y [Parvimonas sp.]MCI5997675.1 ribonuclease Y [Parvimonas sp.]MDD7765529.1 ribonuclease Y [Peptoniphilaceae bacterium]MDY3051070.1 ribonuclease Y [Parvimonas sp.]
MPIEFLLIPLLALVVGLAAGYLFRRFASERLINGAENHAKKIVEDAIKEAETKKKEKLVEAKEEAHKLRQECDRENRERRNEIQKLERRLISKEENLDKKNENLDKKNERLNNELKALEIKESEIEKLVEKQKEELEKVANMTQAEAKEIILEDVKQDSIREAANIIREIEQKAKDEAEIKARNIIGTAIQRYAADHVAESTVSVVSLPNDEMKGRIIGREGRNIRTFETLTGVDLIIDDTPEAVVLSSFDPVRREIARLSLEKLINDGRIHPARIEEMIEKSRQEVENSIRIAGEDACDQTNIHGLHPELVKLLGRLKYRTSYGQNVLKHSIEVAHMAGMLAADIGADIKIAKRGGLLHDIGKAIDHEMEGNHVELGVQMAKKYKEKREVIHCIEAHHNDVEPSTVEALLVQASDAISAAKPGARRESIENYIKRLENLESIANSFDGIEKSFAIQAGREIRVMVKPDVIDEDKMLLTSKEIIKKIQDELEYPGTIKVNLIRETRVVDYAK